MLQLLQQDIDAIPFYLDKGVIVGLDTMPVNEFLSYQFLPLDTTKLFYNIEAFNHESLFSGLPTLMRPFMQQHASTLFLVFALLFVLTSFIFAKSGRILFSNFGHIFTLGNRNKNLFNEQITTDVWGHVFFVFQTIVLYSILFFDLTLHYADLSFRGYESLLLFSQIMAAISLFIFIRYLVYKLVGAVFLDTRTNDVLDAYMWVVYLSGILSFFPLLLYIYISEVRIYALILIFAIFLVGRITVFAKTHTLFVKSHIGILYFFVYLCGVEIMPYFIVYKAITFIM